MYEEFTCSFDVRQQQKFQFFLMHPTCYLFSNCTLISFYNYNTIRGRGGWSCWRAGQTRHTHTQSVRANPMKKNRKQYKQAANLINHVANLIEMFFYKLNSQANADIEA